MGLRVEQGSFPLREEKSEKPAKDEKGKYQNSLPLATGQEGGVFQGI
jgi:hypothetical protein